MPLSKDFSHWEKLNKPTNGMANKSNPPYFRRPTAHAKGVGKAVQVLPRLDLLIPGEPMALDIEGQEWRKKDWFHDGKDDAARIRRGQEPRAGN